MSCGYVKSICQNEDVPILDGNPMRKRMKMSDYCHFGKTYKTHIQKQTKRYRQIEVILIPLAAVERWKKLGRNRNLLLKAVENTLLQSNLNKLGSNIFEEIAYILHAYALK